MGDTIIRKPALRARLGVGKTLLEKNFILHDPADPWVPGTNNSVPRLRKVPLGERAVGFFDDEVDIVFEAIKALRDAKLGERASARTKSTRSSKGYAPSATPSRLPSTTPSSHRDRPG
jgi:hypothetical protein